MTYHRPELLEEALDLLKSQPICVLAGGTDLYPATEFQSLHGAVLDLSKIAHLRGISKTSDEWRIGAMTTWTDIVHADLPEAFLALQAAGREIGSRQIQNRATLAGNLCNASPAADGVPPLLVLDAEVELASCGGIRRLQLSDFIEGPRRTALADDEIMSAVIVPKKAVTGRSAFTKLGARKYLVISIAMTALRLEISGGNIIDVAIATGSCGPVASRLRKLEKAMIGLGLEDLQSLDIETLISGELAPISDIRATGDYRLSVASTQIGDLLKEWTK